MKTKHSLIAIVLVFLISLQLACTGDQIKKSAQAAQDMSLALGLAIDAKRSLAEAKLIDPQEEIALTLGMAKVNLAIRAFNNQVSATKTLDPTSKAQLLTLFQGIVSSVNDLNTQGVLGIKNPDSKAKITAVLAGITVALATVQAILGGA